MAIPINRTEEHSPDVAGVEIFFQNEKKILKNASLRIGSTHGKMLIGFHTKIKIKSNFFDQSTIFAVKKKQKTIKKDQS